MVEKKVLYGNWIVPYDAKAATITITMQNPGLATFAVTLHVGEPHDARTIMTGRAPGVVHVAREFFKGERLWIDYPDGIPAKREAVATVQWEPVTGDLR